MLQASSEATKQNLASGRDGKEFVFPVFVGHTRLLFAENDDIFQDCLFEHDEASHTKSMDAAHDELRWMNCEASLAQDVDIAVHFSHRYECTVCHTSLPTAHLLDLHICELHDSYFAAQVARRMPVYRCLVESCCRKFRTIEDRRQHLLDTHQYPKNYHFDRLHLRRKKGQIRPLPQHQKVRGKNGSRPSGENDQKVEERSSPNEKENGTSDGPSSSTELNDQFPLDEEMMVEGISRLHMAAEVGEVPSTLSFGRRRQGKGMAFIKS